MIVAIEDLRIEKLKHYLSKLEGKKLFVTERIKMKRVLTAKYKYVEDVERKVLTIASFNKLYAKKTGYELKQCRVKKSPQSESLSPKTYWVVSPVKKTK